MQQRLTSILPCNDLDRAEAFFARLGFQRDQGSLDDYRMLLDGFGGFIHLNRAVEGWLQAGRNPFGLYLYREDVDGAARAFAGETIGQPSDTPWGMYEFALNGPDETLVRVGWPSRLRGRLERATAPSRSGNVGVTRPDKRAPMTRKDYDAFCGSLPHATHVVQWGDASVWKIGGKVFAIGGWFDGPEFAVTFKCSKTSFAILSELPGLRPAPYLASRGFLWMQRVDIALFQRP